MKTTRLDRLEGAALAAIVLAGAVLRLAHLGGPSLWWDEIVEIETATAGGLGDVVRAVRRGIPPGAGNAGAVPLDYVLLHLYLRLVPAPAPAHLETYFRFPAFLYAVAALVVLALVCRRHFGRDVALLATLLLALSVPHVLYAAEARFYSLFVLVTLLDLWAFAHLLERPAAPRAWTLYAVVSILYCATGLFALFVVGLQYLALGWMAVQERRGRLLVGPLAGGAALGLVVAVYFAGTSLGMTYGRPVTPDLDLWSPIRDTIGFFAQGSPVLAGFFVLALPLVVLRARCGPSAHRALALEVVLSFLAVPAIGALVHWKHYYFHVRHVLFLLPAFVIVTALGLLDALAPLGRVFAGQRTRRAVNLAVAAAVVIMTQGPAVLAYLRTPDAFFVRTKSLHDMRGLTQHLRGQVAKLAPDEHYLLLAERQSVPNAALSLYLRWYGLDRRIILRGTADVPATLAALGRVGVAPADLLRAPFLRAAVGLTPDFRRLLGLEAPIGSGFEPAPRAGVVAYSPVAPGGAASGLVQRTFTGLTVFETP